MSINGTVNITDKNNPIFDFGGRKFKADHFFNHSLKTGFTDDLLKFANDSYDKWRGFGLLHTANTATMWGGMTNAQKNMIFPKVGLWWYSIDGSDDDSVPDWMDNAAGYKPVLKSVGSTLYLLKSDYLYQYFTEVSDTPEPDEPAGNVYHIHHYIHLVKD